MMRTTTSVSAEAVAAMTTMTADNAVDGMTTNRGETGENVTTEQHTTIK
jgi:hypothetical protein